MKRLNSLYLYLISSLALAALVSPAIAGIPPNLTYQGRVQESGTLVNGNRDINIGLCANTTNGGCPDNTNCLYSGNQTVSVTNGLFRTTFTVPSGVDMTAPVFLEVREGPAGGGASTCLAPREALTVSPYAIVAGTVSASGILGGNINSLVNFMGGNVGIGTVSPALTLDVNGPAAFGAASTHSTFTATGSLFMASAATITLSGGGKVTGLVAPTLAGDAANKGYVDAQVGPGGIYASTGNWSAQQNFLNQITASTMIYSSYQGNSIKIGDPSWTALPGIMTVQSQLGSITPGVYGNFMLSGSYASSDATGASVYLGKIRGTYGAPSIVQSGDELARYAFLGWANTGLWAEGASIQAKADGTWTSGSSYPTRMNFNISPAGATAFNTVMVLNNAGNLGIGTTTPNTKLHMSSGVFTIDGANPGISVGLSTFVVTGGNVGIGTQSPTSKLHVLDGDIAISTTVGSRGIIFQDGSVQTSAASPANFVKKTGDAMTGPLTLAASTLTVQGSAFSVGVSTFVVKSGSVGIGTANPFGFLDISTPSAALSSLRVDTNGYLKILTSNPPISPLTVNNPDGNGPFSSVAVGHPTGDALKLDTGEDAMSNIGTVRLHFGQFNLSNMAEIQANNEGGQPTNRTAGLSFWTEPPGTGTPLVERMRLTGTGNVGIGTTSPLTLLDVNGGSTIRGSETVTSTLTVQGTAFSVGGSTLAVTGGNVGIGTTIPGALLDVSGAAQFGSASKSTFTATPGGATYALQLSSGVTIAGGGPVVLSNGGYVKFGDGTTQTTAFNAGGITVSSASFTQTGNNSYSLQTSSGIFMQAGTLNSAGTILAAATGVNTYSIISSSGINVLAGGIFFIGNKYNNPDYVFEAKYPLMPLSDVRAFVSANKHLPHVPSTKDVAGRGVEIFEQNRVVLENLEASYLYIFELDSQLKEQRAAAARQQAEIEALKAEMRLLKGK